MSLDVNAAVESDAGAHAVSRDPATLNGDLPLSGSERRAYMEHHRRLNLDASADAVSRGIRVHRFVSVWYPGPTRATPSRVGVSAFFAKVLRDARRRIGRERVRVLDIGCGAGPILRQLVGAGFCGEYVGIDIARHPRWFDGEDGSGFSRRLIVGDAQSIDISGLGGFDLLLSSTALEHIEDDHGVVSRLRALLVPTGGEAHYVPGEGSLELYGPHGWRQYGPGRLAGLFPEGRIYRIGGPVSAALHRRAITLPRIYGRGRDLTEARPRLYRVLRSLTLNMDLFVGARGAHGWPTMYGVYVPPGSAGPLTG